MVLLYLSNLQIPQFFPLIFVLLGTIQRSCVPKYKQRLIWAGLKVFLFQSCPFIILGCPPLGVVPKKDQGKFRLIHHLSYPKGPSVNDGISKDSASVSYVSLDRAVDLLRWAGKGALLVKSDIESTFRLLPIHLDCCDLLGCMVDDHYYYDTCLLMGCSILWRMEIRMIK